MKRGFKRYNYFLPCLLLALFTIKPGFSFGRIESVEIKQIELRKSALFPKIELNRELVRPGFIGLISEEEERRISIYLNPLINPQDPYTIKISSLDLGNMFYLGR